MMNLPFKHVPVIFFHALPIFGLIVSKFCALDSAKVHLRFGSHIPLSTSLLTFFMDLN